MSGPQSDFKGRSLLSKPLNLPPGNPYNPEKAGAILAVIMVDSEGNPITNFGGGTPGGGGSLQVAYNLGPQILTTEQLGPVRIITHADQATGLRIEGPGGHVALDARGDGTLGTEAIRTTFQRVVPTDAAGFLIDTLPATWRSALIVYSCFSDTGDNYEAGQLFLHRSLAGTVHLTQLIQAEDGLGSDLEFLLSPTPQDAVELRCNAGSDVTSPRRFHAVKTLLP